MRRYSRRGRGGRRYARRGRYGVRRGRGRRRSRLLRVGYRM